MSLRKAIDNKCISCIYDEHHKGSWRQQVDECTCTDCPLYPVRPRSKKAPKRALESSGVQDD